MPSILTRMMQPACTDRDGLSGVAGRDRREKTVLPVLGDGEGKAGRYRGRGSEYEEGFVIAVAKHRSDPDETPEDVEDDDEAEFCQSRVNLSINQSFNLTNHAAWFLCYR